ncbi:MAG: hypothetical protein JKX70_11285, partial [Phycisphaerales bacterium]|nr:hypothetical protein [Phycisphaerales bacterium]
WTVICEVERGYLDEIRTHLKPVSRSIKHGYKVYAIEKGRYQLVLIDDQSLGHEHAIVMLAPKNGSALLESVLEAKASRKEYAARNSANSANQAPPTEEKVSRSILAGHSDLINGIAGKNTDWSLAWVVRLDNLFPNESVESKEYPLRKPAITAGVIRSTQRGIQNDFAADLGIDLPTNDAPVGLLGAVGTDAILAVSMAQTPDALVSDLFAEYLKGIGNQRNNSQPADGIGVRPDIFGGPGIFIISELSPVTRSSAGYSKSGSSRTIGYTLMSEVSMNDGIDDTNDIDDTKDRSSQRVSARVDQVIHDLLSSITPDQASDYQGRFPGAIRTHIFESQRTSFFMPKNPLKLWSNERAKVSWISVDLPNEPTLIATLGPVDGDCAQQVRWVADAAINIKSIPDQPSNQGILTTGYFRPAALFSQSKSISVYDAAVAKVIERIEWKIMRSSFGLRGTARLEFSDFSKLTKLGKNKSK